MIGVDLNGLMYKLRDKRPNDIIYVQFSENDNCFKYWIGTYDDVEDDYHYYVMFSDYDDLARYVMGI